MRTRSSALNFGAMLLYTAVTMAAGLIASPLIERALGAARFGAFRIILDAQGYLGLLELGLGGALAPLLARALGQGDERALRQTVAAGVRAYLRVALLMLIVGLAVTGFVSRLARGLPPEAVGDLRRAWMIALLGFLGLLLVPFRSLLEARQRGYRIHLLLTVQALVMTGAALVLANAGWGITGQAIALLLGTLAFSLGLIVAGGSDDRRRLTHLSGVTVEPDTRRALWTLSASTLLLNLGGRISLMTDNLVVGGLLDAGMVTSLFFTQRLAVLAQSLLMAIGGSTWAALAELHAKGERAIFNRRLIELSRLVTVLSAAGLGPIVAYNRHFFALWVKSAIPYGGDAIIIVASVNAYLLALTSLWAWCFSATGQTHKVLVPALVGSAVNLAASLLLTSTLGLVGPLLGTTIGFGVSLVLVPWLLSQVFGTSIRALLAAIAPPLIGGAMYGWGLWWIAQRHKPPGWFGLGAEMSAAALLFLAVAAVFVMLDPEARALWRSRLRTLRPGR